MFKEWRAKRYFNKKFKDVDYEFAKLVLIEKLSGSVTKKELANILDAYNSNPCFINAFNLVAYDPHFMAFFELSKKDSLYYTSRME